MDIKTLIVKSSTELFEKRCKEYIENGYKLQTSNISIVKEIFAGSTEKETIFYYYALFIKD